MEAQGEHNLTLEKNIMEKREIVLGFLGELFQELENERQDLKLKEKLGQKYEVQKGLKQAEITEILEKNA